MPKASATVQTVLAAAGRKFCTLTLARLAGVVDKCPGRVAGAADDHAVVVDAVGVPATPSRAELADADDLPRARVLEGDLIDVGESAPRVVEGAAHGDTAVVDREGPGLIVLRLLNQLGHGPGRSRLRPLTGDRIRPDGAHDRVAVGADGGGRAGLAAGAQIDHPAAGRPETATRSWAPSGPYPIACEWTKSGSTWTMTQLVRRSQYNETWAFAVNDSGVGGGRRFENPRGGFPQRQSNRPRVHEPGGKWSHRPLRTSWGCLVRLRHQRQRRNRRRHQQRVRGICQLHRPAGRKRQRAKLPAAAPTVWTVADAFGIDDDGDIPGEMWSGSGAGKLRGLPCRPQFPATPTWTRRSI